MSKERLEKIREEIDKLDANLVSILNNRFALALDVAQIKKELNLPILNAKREEEVLNNISQNTRFPKNMRKVFECIMDESKNIQKDK